MAPLGQSISKRIIFLVTVAGSVAAVTPLIPVFMPAFSSVYAALTLPRKTFERVRELEAYRDVAIVNDYYIRYYVTAIGKRLSIPPPPPPPKFPNSRDKSDIE